jgi:hypothetical protein
MVANNGLRRTDQERAGSGRGRRWNWMRAAEDVGINWICKYYSGKAIRATKKMEASFGSVLFFKDVQEYPGFLPTFF